MTDTQRHNEYVSSLGWLPVLVLFFMTAIFWTAPASAQVVFGGDAGDPENTICSFAGVIGTTINDDCSNSDDYFVPAPGITIGPSGSQINFDAATGAATFGGAVDMGGNVVKNVGTPTAGTDAANKDYVDGVVGDASAKNVEQDGRLDAVEAKNTEQDGRLDSVETKNTEQDATLTDHETRITQTETKNTEQDTRLDGHDTMLASLDTRVTTNTTDIAVLDGRVGALESGFADLGNQISENRTEARQGIAAAIAMTTAPMPSAAGRTSWAGNVGYFKGETAFGGSFAHRFDFNEPFALTAGYAYGGGSSHGFRVGLAGEF
ncbi:hypothetical protein [Mesorhizobium sp. BH1-1-4]|nr:hypothetical protein [Mesorhizobium sp. BH1-1-4]MBZ9998333.1 hypothetical protein [Mesorhizobium sp. BH1-1-4]